MSTATDTPAYVNHRAFPVIFEVRGYPKHRVLPGERVEVDYRPEPHPEGFYLVLRDGGTFVELGRVKELAGS